MLDPAYKLWRSILWEVAYFFLPGPKTRGKPLVGRSNVRKSLIEKDFCVVDYQIDAQKYAAYLAVAQYERFPKYFGSPAHHDYQPRKAIQHYVAADLLQLSASDVYVDIASGGSPAYQIYKDIFGCKSFRQDLKFPAGISCDTIGGDACTLPLPDGFATKMALHCSFEHFEGDSDIRFIREASRVLKPGGKLCIIPFYFSSGGYVILTDLEAWWRRRISFDRKAMVHAMKDYRDAPHVRYYDIHNFIDRIANNLGDLSLKFYFLDEQTDIPHSYKQFVAVFEK